MRKKWLVVFGIVAAIIIGIAVIVHQVGFANIVRHLIFVLQEDTEYAPGYSDSAFRSIKIGDDRERVLEALGTPASVWDPKPYTSWLYAPESFPEYADGETPQFTSTEIHFDEHGRFVKVWAQVVEGNTYSFSPELNTLGLTAKDLDSFKENRPTMEQIEAKLGKPIEVFVSHVAEWLSYSYSPGSNSYQQKKIGIDRSGRVCDKVDEIYWD